MKNNIDRREFLSTIAMLAAVGTAAADARANRPDRLDKRRPLTDLTAVAAVAAMRNGDIQAEDYARALLDRAQQFESLNAFRTMDKETVLEASRTAAVAARMAPLGGCRRHLGVHSRAKRLARTVRDLILFDAAVTSDKSPMGIEPKLSTNFSPFNQFVMDIGSAACDWSASGRISELDSFLHNQPT